MLGTTPPTLLSSQEHRSDLMSSFCSSQSQQKFMFNELSKFESSRRLS